MTACGGCKAPSGVMHVASSAAAMTNYARYTNAGGHRRGSETDGAGGGGGRKGPANNVSGPLMLGSTQHRRHK